MRDNGKRMGEERRWWVGEEREASRDRLNVLNPQDKLSLRTLMAPELDARVLSGGPFSLLCGQITATEA